MITLFNHLHLDAPSLLHEIALFLKLRNYNCQGDEKILDFIWRSKFHVELEMPTINNIGPLNIPYHVSLDDLESTYV